MDYHYYQKVGEYHKKVGGSCQDTFLNIEDSSYSLIALADGVTACKFGKLGAEKAIEALGNFVQLEGEKLFLYAPEKLAYLLVEHVLYYLELTAISKSSDLKDFSSTLSFAYIEKKTGRAVIGSLGDSSIFGIVDNAFKPLLVPTHRTTFPFVTTSNHANKAMSILYCDLHLGDCILLGSDGFTNALLGFANSDISFSELLEKFEFGGLDSYLETCGEADDCTYIATRQTR